VSVPTGEKVRGESGKDAATVMVDDCRLAVHELLRLPDLSTEDLDDRLVAQADAESWDPDGQSPHDFGCSSCLLRASGPR